MAATAYPATATPSAPASDEGLAAAIREIQKAAQLSADPKILMIPIASGDVKLDVPVAMLPTGDGKLGAVTLLETLKAANDFADQLRLRKAPGPDHRKGTAQHQSLQSFIDHANRFKAPNSAVWADPARRSLTSVLDYHQEGAKSSANWGRHRGIYECPLSEAWIAWGAGKPVTVDQDAFAALLDSRDRELGAGTLPGGGKAPDPAALITFASRLEVYSNASAKRERDPQTNKVRISFSEEKGVVGDVQPPTAFLINIPVFEDSNPGQLEVRLRVTVDDGEARFTYQIHAAGDVLRAAFDELCRNVRKGTELPVFVGTPET